jgi:F-type H+-transporting ATPase subunit a
VAPFEEPTRDINMTLGVALWLAAIMYLATLYFRGPGHLLKDLVEPVWFMLPLNLVGKVAEVVSVSFRLFGNIFGGAVIIIVLWDLIWGLFPLPAAMLVNFPLWAVMVLFLTLLVGTVQAFVYTMLWVTYTTNTLGPGEE